MIKYSLFAKMVLFGCAISILPLLALGFFSYMKSSGSIQRHVDQSDLQFMHQLNGNVEQVLRTVDSTMNYVINTNLLQEALYEPLTYYDFQLYNKMKEEISLLQSPDTRVTDVILANFSSNWIINNRGLYTFNDYASKNTLLSLMKLDKGTSWVTLDTGMLGSSDTQSYGCATTVTLIKKMPLNTSEKRGLAIATIPSCSISAMLDSRSDSRQLMILDSDFNVVAYPDQSWIGKPLIDTGYVNADDINRFSGSSGQFQTLLGNRPISVTYVRSSFNGWIYASFTKMSEFTKESRSIGWFTFYVCVLIIGLSILIVWLGSRKVYSPIRQIFDVVAQRAPVAAAASKNELQLIDAHIRELFDSNSMLRSELHQSSRQLRTFFLTKLYQGTIGPAEIDENLEMFGYAGQVAGWEQLAVLTLQIDLLEKDRYERKDLDLLLFAMGNIVEELIPAADRLTPVIVDQTQAVLIGCRNKTAEDFNDYVYKLTEEIQSNLRRYLHLDVSIGISLPFRHLHKASRAYQEGQEALKHRLKLGTGVIVPYFSVNSGKHTRVYFYPKQVENELIDAMKLADEEKSCELLHKWLNEVLHKDRSPHEYQISLVRLLTDLLVVMQEAGIRPEQIGMRESSPYEELLQLYVSSEIENWFKTRFVVPMTTVFRDRQDSQYQNLSEQIIEIVRNEYDTDITLEQCASRLHYNAFYLSSVFKKETNMSFSEYLSQYRFNMAKRWLIETGMPIKEIAEKLTYNNPQNFIRSFRKQEDMTPGQFRAKYSNPNV